MLPKEARDGIMRVWLEILPERYPGVEWVPIEREKAKPDSSSESPASNAERRDQ